MFASNDHSRARCSKSSEGLEHVKPVTWEVSLPFTAVVTDSAYSSPSELIPSLGKLTQKSIIQLLLGEVWREFGGT